MSISCRKALRELSNYVDGELAAQSRRRVEEHLAQCRNCHTIYRSTQNFVRLLRDDRIFALPLGFSLRLQQRVAKMLRRRVQ